MCISPVKVYKKHKNKQKYFFIKGLCQKKWEKGLNPLSVPVIYGIPYTVPCACVSRKTTCSGRQDPGARSAERAERRRKAVQWSKSPGARQRGVGEVPSCTESLPAMPGERK